MDDRPRMALEAETSEAGLLSAATGCLLYVLCKDQVCTCSGLWAAGGVWRGSSRVICALDEDDCAVCSTEMFCRDVLGLWGVECIVFVVAKRRKVGG